VHIEVVCENCGETVTAFLSVYGGDWIAICPICGKIAVVIGDGKGGSKVP